jgi:hypothetical protein
MCRPSFKAKERFAMQQRGDLAEHNSKLIAKRMQMAASVGG